MDSLRLVFLVPGSAKMICTCSQVGPMIILESSSSALPRSPQQGNKSNKRVFVFTESQRLLFWSGLQWAGGNAPAAWV